MARNISGNTMKIKYLVGMLAGLSVAIGSAIVPSATAETKINNTYYCAQLNGSWNTF